MLVKKRTSLHSCYKYIIRFVVCESKETMDVMKMYKLVETLGGDSAMTFWVDNQAAMNRWDAAGYHI